MKNAWKFAFRFITIFILLLSMSSCWEDDKPKTDVDESIALPEPDGIVGRDEARKNYVRYQERRIAVIQRFEDSIDRNGNGKRFIPAEFITFPYDSIKKYMDYIEREAKLSGEKITSLRIYFSNNPSQERYSNDSSIVHPRQNSVMLSPTIVRNKEESIFFTVDDGTEGKRSAVPLFDNFTEKENYNENTIGQDEKSKASLLPENLLPSVSKSPAPFFAEKSTTYNRGHGSPPNQK